MKKVASILAFLLALCAESFAQTAPPAVARTEEYCIVMASQKMRGTKQTITIDKGEPRGMDDEPKPQPFRSAVEALNTLNGQGWELVNSYEYLGPAMGGENIYHYVMKRRITR